MKNSAEPFRIAFWWLTIYCVGAAICIAIPLVLGLELLDSWLGATVPWRTLLLGLAGGVAGGELVGVIAVLCMWWFRPVYVNRDYLVAFRLGGGFRKAKWEEIVAVRPINVLGLRYLTVITTGSRNKLWVPLYLSDREGFYWHVREYAGAEHPLARAVETAYQFS